MADKQITPERVAAVRPATEFCGPHEEGDWEVVDTRTAEVIAVKYESEADARINDDDYLSALGAAEALAAELNAAWPMCGPCGSPTTGELCELARELRIAGMVL
jgi:hypothetical protein